MNQLQLRRDMVERAARCLFNLGQPKGSDRWLLLLEKDRAYYRETATALLVAALENYDIMPKITGESESHGAR